MCAESKAVATFGPAAANPESSHFTEIQLSLTPAKYLVEFAGFDIC